MESSRLANLNDLSDIFLLAQEARMEAAEKRGGSTLILLDADPSELENQLLKSLSEDKYLVVIGLYAEVPVGYGLVEFKETHEKSLHATIKEIFVSKKARSVGVGEIILSLLLSESTLRKAVGIDSVALPGDRETKNFFETQGMVARAIVVHRSLM